MRTERSVGSFLHSITDAQSSLARWVAASAISSDMCIRTGVIVKLPLSRTCHGGIGLENLNSLSSVPFQTLRRFHDRFNMFGWKWTRKSRGKEGLTVSGWLDIRTQSHTYIRDCRNPKPAQIPARSADGDHSYLKYEYILRPYFPCFARRYDTSCLPQGHYSSSSEGPRIIDAQFYSRVQPIGHHAREM
jgi:hypothetical protein